MSLLFLLLNIAMDDEEDLDMKVKPMKKIKESRDGNGIALDPFGLATYKMQGSIWDSQDRDRVVALSSVADSWIKQLQVQHHDFNYFMRMRCG